MDLTWLGHSSFLIKDSKGRTILTDPFDDSIGYEPFKGTADIVTISHHHFEHDYIENINCANILDKAGFFNVCDIPIKAIPSFHDKMKGAKRGENIIYILEVDGYKICHLGDLGYVLSDEEIYSLGEINILLIPIGGNYTIDGKEAAKISNKVNSNIVIPMHYMSSKLSFQLDGLENFLIYMKNGEKVNSNTLRITENLTCKNKVKILKLK